MYISAVTNQASFQKAEILLFETLGESECFGESPGAVCLGDSLGESFKFTIDLLRVESFNLHLMTFENIVLNFLLKMP